MNNKERKLTELKDKSAQEIFVGDIMRSYSGEIQLNSPLNEKVVYREGWFYFENEDGISILESESSSFEIVGNSTENPDFLRRVSVFLFGVMIKRIL